MSVKATSCDKKEFDNITVRCLDIFAIKIQSKAVFCLGFNLCVRFLCKLKILIDLFSTILSFLGVL